MICVQISKPQNICLSFLTIIDRNELLKTNKCFSNKSFSQNKKVNKKSIQINENIDHIFCFHSQVDIQSLLCMVADLYHFSVFSLVVFFSGEKTINDKITERY